MPRSIIDVDINDSKFKEFQRLFNQYQQQLGKQPEAWNKVNKEIDGSKKSYDEIVASLTSANALSKLRAKIEEQVEKSTRTQAEKWKDMVKSTKDFAGNIKSATEQLLKWTSLTGVVAGLIGGGGLFGIDRLALAAGGQRQLAAGAGTSVGASQAFRINYARGLSDPNGFVNRVANAQSDVTQSRPFAALGISNYQNMDPTQLAALVFERSRSMYKHYGNKMGNLYQGAGITDLMSMEDLRRAGNQTDTEVAQSRAGFTSDTASLGRSNDVDAKYQTLTQALDRAENSIENTLIIGLAPLADSLPKLSAAVADLINKLLSNKDLGDFIASLSSGIEDLATYLTSDGFKTDFKSFTDGMHEAAGQFKELVDDMGGFINILKGLKSGASNAATAYKWGGGIPGAAVAWGWGIGSALFGSSSANAATLPPGVAGASSSSAASAALPSSGRNSTATGTVAMVADAVRRAGGNNQAAAALLANFSGESGLDSSKIRQGGTDTGLAQWVGPRRDALYSFARKNGLNPLSDEAQTGYLFQELTTNPTYRGMIQRLNAAPDVVSAAKISGFDFEQGRASADHFGGGGVSQQWLDNLHSRDANKYLAELGGGGGGSSSKGLMNALHALKSSVVVHLNNQTGSSPVITTSSTSVQ